MKAKRKNKVKINSVIKSVNKRKIRNMEKNSEFRVGEGQVIEAIEKAVVGMKKGERKTVKVIPEKGFGKRRKKLLKAIPREYIKGQDAKKGRYVDICFGDERVASAKFVKYDGNMAVIDMNHPLAGKQFVVDVKLLDIQENP